MCRESLPDCNALNPLAEGMGPDILLPADSGSLLGLGGASVSRGDQAETEGLTD